MELKRVPSDVVTGITDHLSNRTSSVPSTESGTAANPTEVFRNFADMVAAIGKYGVATAVFALPLVVACFGLYFLWMAVSGPEASGTKVGVGIFTIVFGSGLLILLWMFNEYELWKKLAPAAKEPKPVVENAA